MNLRAVFFDLHGTLAYERNPVDDKDACELLVDSGIDVHPQAYRAAWQYVFFVDYPRNGYSSWESYLKQLLFRLGVSRNDSTRLIRTSALLARLYRNSKWRAYPEVNSSIAKVKSAGLMTGLITTIPRFRYTESLGKIINMIDLPVDGFTFHCEKSNPKIYLEALKKLDVTPREAVMIGDDSRLDVMEPKGIGMRAILLDRTGELSNKDQTMAEIVVKDLGEAVDYLLLRTE